MTVSHPYLLIIDDDIDDHEILTGAMNNIGCLNVESFKSSVAAINFLDRILLSENYPSLIVLDYNMPGYNGEQVLTQLKKDKPYSHIPVIIYSSYLSLVFKKEMIAFGAYDCIAKSSKYEQLKEHAEIFKAILHPYSSSPSENPVLY